MNVYLFAVMLINAAELALLDTLFCLKLEKRHGFWLRCCLCVLLVLAYLLLTPLDKMSFLIHAPILAISFFYLWFCYCCEIRTLLFFGIAAYTVQRIASLLDSIAAYLAPEQLSHWVGENRSVGPYGFLLIILCDGLVITVSYFVLVRRLWSMELRPNTTMSVAALAVIVLVMNQVWGMYYDIIGEEYASSPPVLIGYAWNLTCCILSLGVQFGIFGISRRDRELEITRKLIADKEQQYKLSKSTMDAINRKCHDLKYQLAAVSAGGGSRHIDEAMELVDSFDSAIHTGNEALDTIFTEKSFYCKKHDITFVCMIDGAKLDFMDVTDQYVMFGNLIDNAIHAVRKVQDHGVRSIYINIHAENKLLLIQTENPFVGELTFSDGLPETTTGDQLNHGYGMSSIRFIAEKYHGSVNTRADNGIFYLNILIPI